jgi:hypothetical protein
MMGSSYENFGPLPIRLRVMAGASTLRYEAHLCAFRSLARETYIGIDGKVCYVAISAYPKAVITLIIPRWTMHITSTLS